MVPEVGQRFGPYEILGKLGSGGMGLVFRAWDERLHREVAIKVLYDDYTMPGMRERFLQEARAASALNHPNLCMVFDIGEQDRNPYLVMELLAGETVKDRIARAAMSVEEIVRYSLEITDALTVAHARGIVHRDIKPANIFLVPMPNGKSQAKVLDFGLAKIELEKRGGWESRSAGYVHRWFYRGNARVYVSRAGQRRVARSADRSLLARRCDVRDGYTAGALQGNDQRHDDGRTVAK